MNQIKRLLCLFAAVFILVGCSPKAEETLPPDEPEQEEQSIATESPKMIGLRTLESMLRWFRPIVQVDGQIYYWSATARDASVLDGYYYSSDAVQIEESQELTDRTLKARFPIKNAKVYRSNSQDELIYVEMDIDMWYYGIVAFTTTQYAWPEADETYNAKEVEKTWEFMRGAQICPTVLVNGVYYQWTDYWKFDWDPPGFSCPTDIQWTTEPLPTQENELSAAFPVSGEIWSHPTIDDRVYLKLDADFCRDCWIECYRIS